MASESPEFLARKTIKCSNVPPKLINKDIAKSYFGQFGHISRLVIKQKSKICIIKYELSESAEYALSKAGSYEDDTFTVEWDEKPPVKKKRTIKEVDPDWATDPSVQAELEAMSNDYIVKRKYNLRPESMQVDPILQAKTTLKKERKTNRIWKMDVPKAKSKNNGSAGELLNILRQPALTIEEQFRALEARDKLIRLKFKKKQIDIAKSKCTVGTCPDMCPEKERLMREVQHQVALYEQEDDSKAMNHSLAVKQYSRSSADQESPLPHDLRNVDVLKMTMGYLMHKIMDMCDIPDINLGEWFHFLWDRTRGIRKDITQQELGCQGSVELVEQCARFHIHCSARLVAEDPSVFDQKINTENLTKCLQTLKYMYHDLEIKGEACVNEAEFRAYVILLNLNDGNFMWEVQQLRPQIQKSPEVKFALNVYSALDKNNYVKFFKLVKSTTYLNACILLRYFIQVRIKALRTLIKSYSPRNPHTSFPIMELNNILAFEGMASTVDFMEYYGLNVNDERTVVVLDRRMFTLPDITYTLDRAVNVIESKRTISVGEAVCGHKLPPPLFEQHITQNSFNSEGYIDISEFNEFISVQEAVVKPSVINVHKERSNSPLIVSENKEKAESMSIFGNSNSQDSSSITKHGDIPNFFFSRAPIAQSSGESLFKDFDSFGGSSQDSMFPTPEKKTDQVDCAKLVHGGFTFDLNKAKLDAEKLQKEKEEEEKEKLREMEIRRKEEEDLRLKEEVRLAQEKVREEIHLNEIKEQARQQKLQQKIKEQRKKQAEALRLKQEEDELKRLQEQEIAHKKKLEQKIQLEVENVMSKILKTIDDQNRRSKHLSELKDRILKRHVVNKWRRRVATNKRKRKAIDQSPLWVSFKSTKDTVNELYSLTQDVTLNLMKRYRHGTAVDIIPKIRTPIKKIKLVKITYDTLFKNYAKFKRIQNNYYWKVNIVTPKEDDSKALSLIDSTLDSYLGWKAGNDSKILLEQHTVGVNKITYCVQNAVNIDNEADGFIFMSDRLDAQLYDRILSFVENLGSFIILPIVIVLKEEPSNLDRINEISDQGLIFDYKIIVKQYSSENIQEATNEALIFLADNVRPPPTLELNTLRSFLFQYLSELWQRITSFSKWNVAYKKCLTSPEVIINLYNEAIDKLKCVVLSDNCYEYANFPSIFQDFLPTKIPDFLPCDYKYFPAFWKKPSYKRKVHDTMELLKIPKNFGIWPPQNQADLEHCVYKYCGKIFENPDCCFYKIMASILRNFGAENLQSILWTNIVEIISCEKMNELDYNLDATFSANTIFNQLFVIYEISKLQEYTSEPWFYLQNPIIAQEIDMDLNRLPEVKPVIHETSYEVDLDKTLSELEHKEDSIEDREGIDNFQRLMQDLEQSMEISKQINSKFQSNLKRVLRDT